MADEQSTEDVVSKYKRLLSLARSSLEANHATLAAKDKEIEQLASLLEEEKRKSSKRNNNKDDAAAVPRKIVCRVDVEELIWVLIEYEDGVDSWKCFGDEQALHDYIQRVTGIPLECPHRCLTAEESSRVVCYVYVIFFHLTVNLSHGNEIFCRKVKLVKWLNELWRSFGGEFASHHTSSKDKALFIRYKVRTEIAKKQRESENRQALINGNSILNSPQSSSTLHYLHEKEENADNSDEVQKLQKQLKDQELKWKSAYDKLSKENDVLRSKGGEALIAMQWRSRYESCLKEKEDTMEKLKIYTKISDDLNLNGKTAEQALAELQDEYEVIFIPDVITSSSLLII